MREILIFLIGVLYAAGVRAGTPGEVPVGGQLREARMFSVSGPPRMLSTFRGKPLIINVWASWCGPCRAEMSSLQRLSQIDAKKQFRVIGISTDDDAIAASEYVVKSKLTFENFVDYNLLMENMLGANTIPLTLLIDANGRVLAKIRGSRDWTSAESIALVENTMRIKLAR
ncbi:MAG: TlpA family protein disulfide reductase [Betaproteobacteria bacterium]|nr:TlpA family protein disulfide reductase [Betaproteobacteria bacterium]